MKEKKRTHITHGFPPFYDGDSKILILGSFPSVKSREAQFFYGHPQNRFWKVVSDLRHAPLPVTKEEKAAFLKKMRIAMYDSIEECDICGSSDSTITNVTPADLTPVFAAAKIRTVFCNGTASYNLYMKYLADKTGFPAVRLPSTSPANAAWSLARLEEAWAVINDSLN